jgi:receptor protein-tyrosine kinase
MNAMPMQENVLPLDPHKPSSRVADRMIGAILIDEGKLSIEDAEQILRLQKEQGLRFGEAALQLGLVTDADLRHALAKQYEYSYLLPEHTGVSKELIAAYEPFSKPVEELRALRTLLLLRWFNPDAGRKMLAIVSPGAGEGRSYLAASLAVVMSQVGERTLLIDADLRAPRQHTLFGLTNRSGFSSILSGRGDASAIVPIKALPGLSVLPAGDVPPNPQELLRRPAFAAMLVDAQDMFDIVLMDTPACIPFADAQIVAAQSGGAVMLARKHHTRISEMRDLETAFGNAGAKVVGNVISEF